MTQAGVGDTLEPGDRIGPLVLGKPAHGGYCVARWQGRVVFVRGGIPSESVEAEVSAVRPRHAFAEVTAVLEPSVHRRRPPCAVAGRCGGCDLQHMDQQAALEWKTAVVTELLERVGAGLEAPVEAVTPDFGWRTRMRYLISAEGQPGLRGRRSHEWVEVPSAGCLIASPSIGRPLGRPEQPGELVMAATATGPVYVRDSDLSLTVTEEVGGHTFEVAADGFWQAHREAPRVLTEAVMAATGPEPGEVAFDLFCGVGLFAAVLAARGARVWGVEGSRRAVELARGNVPGARFFAADVAAGLRRLPRRADLVVMDPPRTGAGRSVVEAALARRPRMLCYVACDPATLARDLRTAIGLGYRVEGVRAFDLFPQTHHVECVARLVPA